MSGLLALLTVSATTQVPDTALAQIERITVGGTPSLEPAGSEVRVVRGQQIVSARTALPLVEDDEILTGANVTVTILSLEEVAEEDKSILIGPASQVRIRSRRSIFLILGRILANVRGVFDVATARATLGSRSTEFEVSVTEDGGTHLVVLEGTVDVQRGEEAPVGDQASRWLLRPVLLSGVHAAATGLGARQLPQPAAVGRLEELTIRRGEPGTRVRATSEDRVRGVMGWAMEPMLAGQPSHTAKRVLPHFDSAEDRAKAYRQAKLAAVWHGEPGAYETLGKVYLDWNEGARAVDAFTREVRIDQARQKSPGFLANLGEGMRMKGRLKEAEEQLARARAIEPQNARALNGLGNVYFARAAVAQDSGAFDSARELLEKCLTIYTETRKAGEDRPAATSGIAWANDGEAKLSLGDIARQQGRLDEAAARYGEASDAFARAQKASPHYAHASIGVADSARRTASVAQSRGATDEAKRAYGDAEARYREALEAHPDLSAAHLGLGDVFVETGRRQQAVESYTLATMVRPEEPAPYLRLGLVLAAENPKAAAQYAQRYLALEQAGLRKGQRAALATKIAGAPATATVTVPNLLKLPERSAREALEGARLAVGEITVRPGPPGDGSIVEQSLAAGTAVPPGTAVSFVVSSAERPLAPGPSGSSELRVPKVEDLPRAAAEQIIQRQGFRVGRIEAKESSKTPGTVLDQNPEAGRRAPAGSPIDLEIAVPRDAKVPGVVGAGRDRAVRELRASGLAIGSVSEQASCEVAGTVLAQEPDEGTRVEKGTAVSVVIAGPGPRPVRVPRVIGLRLQDAERTLREQQLKIRRVERQAVGRARPDTILSQNPDPSALAAPGCFVDLVIAAAAPPVTVPNFVGMTQNEALALLPRNVAGRLGLTLGAVVYRDVRARAGTVIEQSPKPGTVVEAGTPVSLAIARPRGAPADEGVTVPDVRGMYRKDAEAILTRLKLRVEVTAQSQRRGYKEGQVISQSVAPNRRVAPGTVIRLLVATTID